MAKAYAHKFVRVTISGYMFGGAEEWSTNFQMGSPTADMTATGAPGPESIATAWATLFTTGANGFSNSYYTTQVKSALINTNGTTDTGEVEYYTYPTAIYGGKTGAGFPPQITLAATLTSDTSRGLASKGRMYLPGISEPLDMATGKLSNTYTNTLNTAFKTFLDAVNVGSGVSGKVVLASAGHKTTDVDENGQPEYLAGVTRWVTGCRIGNVYDTQRRRRNGLQETYNTKVLA